MSVNDNREGRLVCGCGRAKQGSKALCEPCLLERKEETEKGGIAIDEDGNEV